MMNNRNWTTVSYLLHPLFMPTLGTFIVMWNDPRIYLSLNSLAPWVVVLATVFICTALLPLLFSWTLFKLGRVKSLKNPDEQDRRILMMFAELGFLLTYITFHKIPELGHSLSLFMLGINMAIVATFILNFFQKTSFHATGTGGILGTAIGLMYYTRISMWPWVTAAMILCCLAGYARYRLKAHNTFEIYLGFIVGMVSLFAVFFFGAK